MRCREAELQLSVYRELTDEERAAVDAHLAICPACAQLAAAHQAVDDRLTALPRLDPPPRIRAEVLARLGESQRPWARRGRRLLAGLATVVLLIALAVGLRSWWFPPGPMLRTGAPEPLTEAQVVEKARAYADGALIQVTRTEARLTTYGAFRGRGPVGESFPVADDHLVWVVGFTGQVDATRGPVPIPPWLPTKPGQPTPTSVTYGQLVLVLDAYTGQIMAVRVYPHGSEESVLALPTPPAFPTPGPSPTGQPPAATATPVSHVFAGHVRLVGSRLFVNGPVPGEPLYVVLDWQALRPPQRPQAWTASVSLENEDGQEMARDDRRLVLEADIPRISTQHWLTLPSDAPEGFYKLRVRLSDPATGQQLRVGPTDEDSVVLAVLPTIRPMPRPVTVGPVEDFPPDSVTPLELPTSFTDPYAYDLNGQGTPMPTTRTISSVPIFLVHDPEVGFLALYNRDPHRGCRVVWMPEAERFLNPCHGERYNRRGEYMGGPSPRGLDRFPVSVVDGQVVVDVGRLIPGPPRPEPPVGTPYPRVTPPTPILPLEELTRRWEAAWRSIRSLHGVHLLETLDADTGEPSEAMVSFGREEWFRLDETGTPQRFKVLIHTREGVEWALLDGQSSVRYDPQVKRFYDELPATAWEVWADVRDFSLLIHLQPPWLWASPPDLTWEKVEAVRLDGWPAFQLTGRWDGTAVTLWLDGQDFLPRQRVIVYSTGEARIHQRWQATVLEINPDLPDSIFDRRSVEAVALPEVTLVDVEADPGLEVSKVEVLPGVGPPRGLPGGPATPSTVGLGVQVRIRNRTGEPVRVRVIYTLWDPETGRMHQTALEEDLLAGGTTAPILGFTVDRDVSRWELEVSVQRLDR